MRILFGQFLGGLSLPGAEVAFTKILDDDRLGSGIEQRKGFPAALKRTAVIGLCLRISAAGRHAPQAVDPLLCQRQIRAADVLAEQVSLRDAVPNQMNGVGLHKLSPLSINIDFFLWFIHRI